MPATALRTSARRHHRAIGTGIGLSSAAVLIFEIVLSRVFAITQFHHFVFVTVSLALLGFGASGSLLTAVPALGRGGPRRWALLAAAQSVMTVAAYAVVNRVPFDSFSIAWDTGQIWLLAFNYVVLALPFLFGGLVIGVLLTGRDQPHPMGSHRIYAYSLGGSGIGCVVALGGLSWLGGVGMILVAAVAAMLGAMLFAVLAEQAGRRLTASLAGASALLAIAAVLPPSLLDMKLSPYKSLSALLRIPGTEVASTRWSAVSRVDHVTSPAIRSLPGLSFTYPGDPPPQDGLTFDGDDLSPIPLVGPEDAGFTPYLLGSLPYLLRPGADVAVLEPKGGLNVVTALASGAGTVTAVEPNALAVRAVGRTPFDVYGHSQVETVIEEPRVFIERTEHRFDVIDLALTDPYRPVSSGAYSLAEDYLLTRQAATAYLERLEPDGILAIMRWLQLPPSEESRVVALAADAVRAIGGEPAEAVIALRGYATLLVLVEPDGFTPGDLAVVGEFAADRRFDLVATPGLTAVEANRFNRLLDDEYYRNARALLTGNDPQPTYAASRFDISPPTDDHPFFSHFFKWSQAGEVIDTLGTTWQPFGGAGYFVLIAVLVLATTGALLLIVVPLGVARLRRRNEPTPAGLMSRVWVVGYFGFLGLAFLFVEIPIIQQYILLIGRPTSAFAVVLFALLISSGLGSRWSRHIPWRAGAATLAVTAVAYPFLMSIFTEALLPASSLVRMTAGALVLFPLGFLMGTMFPNGLAHLERNDPGLVPWAWGINGVCSVISAAAATLLALSFGFRAVILLGALCYAVCALLARVAGPGRRGRLTPRPG